MGIPHKLSEVIHLNSMKKNLTLVQTRAVANADCSFSLLTTTTKNILFQMKSNNPLNILSVYSILLKVTGNALPIKDEGTLLNCSTVSGPNPNATCIFPFKLVLSKSVTVTYHQCTTTFNDKGDTTPWCSTKVDDWGLHLGGNENWGNCGPDCTSLARLEKCLIDDMMPFYGSEKCYPLFKQGPCNDGEWFVLNSAIDGTLLPYAQCENVLDCDVFTLKEDFEGPECIPCETADQNFIDGEYIGCTGTRLSTIGGNGLDNCDEGQVKDTRGECKIAYTISPPKEEEDVEKRESTERPRRPRDLRKYLQSKYRFG